MGDLVTDAWRCGSGVRSHEGKPMSDWKTAARDALVSGSMASVTSTAALMVCGEARLGRPFAPTNAVSHWFWGAPATRADRFSLRHTVVGYLTHHAASVFWALWHEKLFGSAKVARRTPALALGDAAATAAFAYVVDYRLTPRRLMPGYERRLSRRSLFAVYTAFAAGLALGGALLALSGRR
jgi:hypothetical protein